MNLMTLNPPLPIHVLDVSKNPTQRQAPQQKKNKKENAIPCFFPGAPTHGSKEKPCSKKKLVHHTPKVVDKGSRQMSKQAPSVKRRRHSQVFAPIQNGSIHRSIRLKYQTQDRKASFNERKKRSFILTKERQVILGILQRPCCEKKFLQSLGVRCIHRFRNRGHSASNSINLGLNDGSFS